MHNYGLLNSSQNAMTLRVVYIYSSVKFLLFPHPSMGALVCVYMFTVHVGSSLLLPPLPPLQYARDFYIGQWLRDSQLELEKALRGNADSPTDPMILDEGDDPAISSSAIILQQAEVKKEMLHSLMETKTLTRLK